MPKLLFKLPSRSRPAKLIETIQNVIDFAEHDDYVILVSLDEDDGSCNNERVLTQLDGFKNVLTCIGNGTGSKVEAINRNMNEVDDWDICFVISDDMKFIVKGFDKIVIGIFDMYFKNRMGVLHTYDGVTNERQITMAVFNKAWYDYWGFIYNPIFQSVFCDTEMKDVAELLGAYHCEPIILNRHLHRAWGLAPNDALYDRNEHADLYRADCETYNNRRRVNFGLPINYGQ